MSELSTALALLQELQVAYQRGDRASVVQLVGELLAMRAPMGDQWQQLASLALRYGEFGLARQTIDLFVEARGGDSHAQYAKAALLEQSGALREAYALMCALPPDQPNPAANAYSRGTAALYLGEKEEGRRQLLRAVELQPASGAAWLSLAMATDLSADPELATRIVAAEDHAVGMSGAQRAAYCYAQGKAYAESGDPQRAFASFARGAREMKSVTAYDREADRASAEEAVRGFDGASIAALARRQSEPTDRTIFVTGLPRSGTTLVQHILGSHSAVGDGAETSLLALLAEEIGGPSAPAIEHYAAAHGVAHPAQLWGHWTGGRFPAAGRVVDKSLDTSRFLGLAATLLPEAPLVWLTRDPLDRAWSCFRTFFAAGLPWSFDLEDIAFHFRLEDALLARWQDLLGDRLLVIPFEQLANEPEPWIRRILSHCGLAAEPAVFAPHDSGQTVTTASVAQVRQPISARSVGSAEPYRPFLQPFIDAYFG